MFGRRFNFYFVGFRESRNSSESVTDAYLVLMINESHPFQIFNNGQ